MLNMGKEVKIVTAFYDHGALFHIYLAPLVRYMASCYLRLAELPATA